MSAHIFPCLIYVSLGYRDTPVQRAPKTCPLSWQKTGLQHRPPRPDVGTTMRKLLLLTAYGFIGCKSTAPPEMPGSPATAPPAETLVFQPQAPRGEGHTVLVTKTWQKAGRVVTWQLEVKPPEPSRRSSYCYKISTLPKPLDPVRTSDGLTVSSVLVGDDDLILTQQVFISPTGRSVLIVEEKGEASTLQHCVLVHCEASTKSDRTQSINLPESPGPLVPTPCKVQFITDSAIYYSLDSNPAIRELPIRK
jgi:hypothetical protein